MHRFDHQTKLNALTQNSHGDVAEQYRLSSTIPEIHLE
jgi:hypothetical protein